MCRAAHIAETKMRVFMRVRAIACIAMAYACGVTPSPAQAVDYKGKQVTIVIGYGVGGTYSQYAQLFSHHLGKFLPGNPGVIMQSMPGAGGVRMVNEAAVRMRGDGTTIFVPPDTMAITQLLETSGIFYDARNSITSAPPISRTISGSSAGRRGPPSPT